jgi:hypothetical protein
MINYIKIGFILAMLGSFCYVVYDHQKVVAENERLTTELSIANSTINALDNIVKKNKEIDAVKDSRIDEIEKEPETNDADTAPVLLRALKRLH